MKFLLAFMAFAAGISFACSATRSATTAEQPANAPPQTTQSEPLASTSSGQEKSACNLKMSELPAIKGLKLGMTPDEVLVLFPGSKDDAKLRARLSEPPGRYGNSTFLMTPANYVSSDEFKEVSRLSFDLLDGRVSTFTISYNGPQWPHIDKFVEKFVEDKDLPAIDQWAPYVGMDDQMKTLTCADFAISIFAGGEGGNLNYVLIQDLEADKKLKERRAKARATATPSPENSRQ